MAEDDGGTIAPAGAASGVLIEDGFPVLDLNHRSTAYDVAFANAAAASNFTYLCPECQCKGGVTGSRGVGRANADFSFFPFLFTDAEIQVSEQHHQIHHNAEKMPSAVALLLRKYKSVVQEGVAVGVFFFSEEL